MPSAGKTNEVAEPELNVDLSLKHVHVNHESQICTSLHIDKALLSVYHIFGKHLEWSKKRRDVVETPMVCVGNHARHEISECASKAEQAEQVGLPFQGDVSLSMISTLPLSGLHSFNSKMIVPFFLETFSWWYTHRNDLSLEASSCFNITR